MIYGWLLQIPDALLPYVFARTFRPEKPARLGGSWVTRRLLHLGGVLWAGLCLMRYQVALHGLAFGLWALSRPPIAASLWQSLQAMWPRLELSTELAARPTTPGVKPDPEPATVLRQVNKWQVP